MSESNQPKPLYTIGIDSAVNGDDITVTATFEWTPEGKFRLMEWIRGITPYAAALKTNEGTLLLLPLKRNPEHDKG